MKQEKQPVALLINDIHASKDNIPEFILNWNEALEICHDKGIGDIVIGGDLWQSRSSQPLTTLLAVKQAIQKAVQSGIYITIAEGNHDKVDLNMLLGYSHIFDGYKDVSVVGDYSIVDLSDVCSLYVMSYFTEDEEFIGHYNEMLKSLSNDGRVNILYIHEGINGGLATPTGKELPADMFSDFDKVLVGHYHDRKKIKGTNIEYIGASRQHNYGEGEMKGYTVLYDDGSYEFIQNKVNIRYKTIDIQFDNLNDETLSEIRSMKKSGNYKIKARISCDQTNVSSVDKQKLLDAGVNKVEIDTDNVEISSVDQKRVEQKFDKTGIKREYSVFCEEKDISDVEFGLEYLDKIN